jgi:hypothetical protein
MTNATHESIEQDTGSLNLGRLAPASSVIGLIGLIVCMVLMFTGNEAMKTQMMGSYMFGFIFWIGITLGFFGLSLLHNCVRGNWSVAIIRILEAGGSYVSFIVMFVLFLPILANMKAMYAWADPAKVAADKLLIYKSAYLNPSFFLIRLGVYLVLWAGLAWFLRNSAMRQEASKDFKLESGRSSWAAPGIVMFFLTCTFAFTDWVMSLEPHWYSTMYGTWTIVSACLGALALSTLIFCVNADKMPFKTVMRPDLTKDLGNMLFVLTMLWGYTSLSQFLIIWNGNLPETASYYHNRGSNIEPMTQNFTWGAVGLICIVGQFFVPFFGLITPRTKKTAMNLAKMAGWIFVVHIIDIYQYVIPALPGGRGLAGPVTPAIATDALAWVAVGAIWLFVFGSVVKKAPLLPTYDTRLQEAVQNAH